MGPAPSSTISSAAPTPCCPLPTARSPIPLSLIPEVGDMRDTALFRPFRYKGLALDNRIAMAPMTRYLAPDGIPAPDAAAYYSRRAAGGVGLIITEGVGIDREASRDRKSTRLNSSH